jgi:hypothetical protein
MSDRRRRLDWEWEEIVLACDLVYQNGWRQLDEGDPRVRELSGILQQMSIHPLDARLSNFRNFAGVAQKTRNIATVHPDYVGSPSNGNKLDKKVLDEFLDDPERMRNVAVKLRRLALTDEPENISGLSVMRTRASWKAATCCGFIEFGSGALSFVIKRSRVSWLVAPRFYVRYACSTSKNSTGILARASSNVITLSPCMRVASAPETFTT